MGRIWKERSERARERESARVEGLVDRVGWKNQASRDVTGQPSSDIDTYISGRTRMEGSGEVGLDEEQ